MTKGERPIGALPNPSNVQTRNHALGELLATWREQFGDLTETERAEARSTFDQIDSVVSGDPETEGRRRELAEEIMREDSDVLRRLAQ